VNIFVKISALFIQVWYG